MRRITSAEQLPAGVRAYAAPDLCHMCDIFNETASSGCNSPVGRAFSQEEFATIISYLDRDNVPVYVLERNNEVIAWLSINRFSWGGTQACKHTGEVSVYVCKDRIGRGAGIRLGHAAVWLAERYGFETLVAWVLAGNDTSARSVQALGAELWGRFPGIARFGSVRADVLLYGLHLKPLQAPDTSAITPVKFAQDG